MGCVFSQPILSDTSIIANVQVHRYLAQRGYTTFKNDASGLLYTDGNQLSYEMTCGGDTRACCKCCKQSIPLSSIQNIQVVNGPQMVRVKRPNGTPNTIPVTSGHLLVITIEGGVIYASVDDIGSFPQTLANLSGKPLVDTAQQISHPEMVDRGRPVLR